MPASSELTGQRFGRLLVIGAAGRVKFGRLQTAWLCECNCGRREMLAQALLTQRGWRECSYCQRPECVECGEQVPASRPRSNTCSDACAQAKQQAQGRDSYHRRAADPAFNRARHQRAVERMDADPALAEHIRAQRRAAGERWREANRDTCRQQAAQHYAAHRDTIQAKRRARLDAMSAEQLSRWRERIRAYGRAYRQRWRAALRADPDRHRAYLDLMREYRTRNADG